MAPRVTVHFDPKHECGSDEWAQNNALFTANTLRSAEGDCTLIAGKMPFFRQYAARHGKDWGAYCRETFRAEPQWIEKIEEGVAVLLAKGHAGPITSAQAQAASETFQRAEATREPGGKREGAGRPADVIVVDGRVVPNPDKGPSMESSLSDKHDSARVKREYGTSSAYLAGRIKAKAAKGDEAAKAVAEAVGRGDYDATGMRAAARDAGILRPPDPVRVAVRAVRAVPADRLTEFARALPAATLRALVQAASSGLRQQEPDT